MELSYTGKECSSTGEKRMESSKDLPSLISSIACLISFLVYGASCASIGAALPYLADQMDVSTGAMGVAFTTRGVGYTVGTLGSAYFMSFSDNYLSKDIVNCVGLCVSGVSIGIIGNSSNYPLALVSFFFQGAGFGCMDTYANCCFPELWGERVQPWLQALHTCFGIGAIIGPAIVGGCGLLVSFNIFFVLSFLPFTVLTTYKFMCEETLQPIKQSSTCKSPGEYELSTTEPDSELPPPILLKDDEDEDIVNHEIILSDHDDDDKIVVQEESNEIQKDMTSVEVNLEVVHPTENTESTESKSSPPLLIRSMITLFLFLYVGYIVGFSGWIPYYALDSDVTSSYSEAAYLSSYFYITLTIGRFISIGCTIYLSKTTLMCVELSIMLIAAVLGMIILNMNYSATAVVTSLTALSLSSIYPIMLTIVDDFHFKVDATDMKIFIVGGTLGEAIIPIFYGILLDTLGFYSFSVFSLALTGMLCVLFASLYIIATHWKTRTHREPSIIL